MKIAVIGANGKSGTLVVREAIERGHEVTAIMRSEHPTQAQHTLIKDVFALTRNDLLGFDAVVDAFGAWTPENLHLHKDHLIHLADALSGTQTRLLVIGSAGSLYPRLDHGSAACRLARYARRIQTAGYRDGAGV